MKLDGIHEYNPDVHYRLYLSPYRGPVVICVQDFDYPDYDETRFLSPDAWDNEAEAEAELDKLKLAVAILRSNPLGFTSLFHGMFE